MNEQILHIPASVLKTYLVYVDFKIGSTSGDQFYARVEPVVAWFATSMGSEFTRKLGLNGLRLAGRLIVIRLISSARYIIQVIY